MLFLMHLLLACGHPARLRAVRSRIFLQRAADLNRRVSKWLLLNRPGAAFVLAIVSDRKPGDVRLNAKSTAWPGDGSSRRVHGGCSSGGPPQVEVPLSRRVCQLSWSLNGADRRSILRNACVEGEPPGERHGHAGRHYDGKPLKLLFVGDSIAVGVGAKIAAPLQAACAERLAKIQRRPVEWCTIAANGADVRELHALVDENHSFDIAVVLCGVNDGKKFLQGL